MINILKKYQENNIRRTAGTIPQANDEGGAARGDYCI
jgi:hypothetical protein